MHGQQNIKKNVLFFGSESKFIVVAVLIQAHQPQWLFASA